MAEGFLRHFASDSFDVQSAGSNPAFVNPNAIKALSEIGIDISGHHSKSIDEFDLDAFDYVITTCDEAYDACPVTITKAKTIHLNLRDPAKATGDDEEVLKAFREARDEIKDFVLRFINEEAKIYR
jgi:arsenate reductase